MRVRSSLLRYAIASIGFGVWGCAVYDESLLAGLTEGDGIAGAAPANGGSPGVAGRDSVAGTAGASGAGATSGAGGEPFADAGAGGIGEAGAAGSAGDGAEQGGSGGIAGGAGTEAGGTGGTGGSAGTVAGSGGSGGAPPMPLCPAHPLTPRTSWIPTASHQSTTPKNLPSALTDGLSARWSSGKAQSGDEWIQIDFGAVVTLRSINLQQGGDTNDYPRSYAVILSDTSNNLTGTARASGVGTQGPSTLVTLPKPAFGRYLLVKQVGSSLSWWSIAEVEVACFDD